MFVIERRPHRSTVFRILSPRLRPCFGARLRRPVPEALGIRPPGRLRGHVAGRLRRRLRPLGNARQGHPDRAVRHGHHRGLPHGPLEHRCRGTTLRGRHGRHGACPLFSRRTGPHAAARHGGGGDGRRGALGADRGHPAGVARRQRDPHDAHAQLRGHLLLGVSHPRTLERPGRLQLPPFPGLFRGGAPARPSGIRASTRAFCLRWRRRPSSR